MKPLTNTLSILTSGLIAITAPTLILAQQQDDPCQSKLDAAKKMADDQKKKFDQAKGDADKHFEDDKQKYDACLEGTITMEDNHWGLHVPEFVMKEQKWAFDFPKIELIQQDVVFHTPSVKCDTGVIAHQPVTVCESYKPLENPFPKCNIEMRPIIGSRCEPFMQEQRIKMGIPEAKSQRVEWYVKVPEVTMKRQDWYFKLPKFKPTSGCLGGSDCSQKCQSKLDSASAAYQGKIGPQSALLRTNIATSSHDANMCYRDVMVTRRDVAAAQYDAGIAQLQASITSLATQGNTDIVAQLRKDQERMLKERQDLVAQINRAIADIEASDRKMMNEMAK